MRLDVYLATFWPENSRATWQKYCKAGYVLVNKQSAAKPDMQLGEDDAVSVNLPANPDFTDHSLPIIYEDDDVAVVNKPAGVLTHSKGVMSHEFTVGEFMKTRTTDNTDSNRPGIVHRLDRDTSGVMIAAKTPEAKHWLQKQFAIRKVKKTYIALVKGHLKEPSAQLDLPIERNPKKPQTFRVGPNGKAAQTIYETIKVFKDYTLVRLKPTTGRTHQLRVHMAYLGHPIVGDRLYGNPKPSGLYNSRMFLHAESLELTLPSRDRKVFKAPLPKELGKLQKDLALI